MVKVSKDKLDELINDLETKLEDIRTDNVNEYDATRRSSVYTVLKKVETVLAKET